MPLIGSVMARGATTDQLSGRIAEKLRDGFIREPHVAVEIEAYRPFFILGEVTAAGPISLRRQHDRGDGGGDRRRLHAARLPPDRRREPQLQRPARAHERPLTYPLRPGDTVNVQERWF